MSCSSHYFEWEQEYCRTLTWERSRNGIEYGLNGYGNVLFLLKRHGVLWFFKLHVSSASVSESCHLQASWAERLHPHPLTPWTCTLIHSSPISVPNALLKPFQSLNCQSQEPLFSLPFPYFLRITFLKLSPAVLLLPESLSPLITSRLPFLCPFSWISQIFVLSEFFFSFYSLFEPVHPFTQIELKPALQMSGS